MTTKRAITIETSLDEAKRTGRDIFTVIDEREAAREIKENAAKVSKPGSWKMSLGDGRIRHGLSKRKADKLAMRYNRFTGTSNAYVTK